MVALTSVYIFAPELLNTQAGDPCQDNDIWDWDIEIEKITCPFISGNSFQIGHTPKKHW